MENLTEGLVNDGKRFDFSVICQIAYFIGMSVEDLTQPTLTAEQIEQEKQTHYMIEYYELQPSFIQNRYYMIK